MERRARRLRDRRPDRSSLGAGGRLPDVLFGRSLARRAENDYRVRDGAAFREPKAKTTQAAMDGEERQQRILVVDDEPAIRDVLATYLRAEGFAVDEAGDGRAALRAIEAQPPDLLLLDLSLPVVSGIEVFRRLRRTSDVPVIMVTSRVNEVDRVVGLELGADDYVGKPFSPREIVARVKGVLRRTSGDRLAAPVARPAVASGSRSGLEIDYVGHQVRVGSKSVALTPTEFRILDLLSREPGRAFTRDQILDRISSDAETIFDRTLDRHIANLRAKIEAEPSRPRHIVTVFGVGYKFVS
jgi:DNA-binding response OmpR family regulator